MPIGYELGIGGTDSRLEPVYRLRNISRVVIADRYLVDADMIDLGTRSQLLKNSYNDLLARMCDHLLRTACLPPAVGKGVNRTIRRDADHRRGTGSEHGKAGDASFEADERKVLGRPRVAAFPGVPRTEQGSGRQRDYFGHIFREQRLVAQDPFCRSRGIPA